MRNSYILAAGFLLLFVAFTISAQTTPDYSGDWTLDKDKSELGERSRVKSMTMNVSQTDKTLTYERKAEREAAPEGGGGGRGMGGGRGPGGDQSAMTFSLDGKETKAETGRGEAKLKAKAESGKLELTTERSFEGPMGSISIKTVETWELSSDGKTLIVSSETKTPRGDQSQKMVFTKN
ncbi:MAG: hypothetical protein KDB79_06140 [Acidobacteria bacterium]|nr:hypothetical protein [Acidobacteriota bacterium]